MSSSVITAPEFPSRSSLSIQFKNRARMITANKDSKNKVAALDYIDSPDPTSTTLKTPFMQL